MEEGLLLNNIWKLLTMAHLYFWILAFSTIFCRIKSYLNAVWPQAIGFQKLAKMDHFWLTFVHSICKHSSLRSPCWMRLFGVIFKHYGTGLFSQGADKPLWANNPFFISWIKRHFGQFMGEISAVGFFVMHALSHFRHAYSDAMYS